MSEVIGGLVSAVVLTTAILMVFTTVVFVFIDIADLIWESIVE